MRLGAVDQPGAVQPDTETAESKEGLRGDAPGDLKATRFWLAGFQVGSAMPPEAVVMWTIIAIAAVLSVCVLLAWQQERRRLIRFEQQRELEERLRLQYRPD